MKLATGVLFAILGVVVIVRLAESSVGLRLEAIPGYVFGLALIGLCAARFWAYGKQRSA